LAKSGRRSRQRDPPHAVVKLAVELRITPAGFSRTRRLREASMLWQHCRRSLLRRSLKFHRTIGKPMVLEDLFRDERGYRRPRTKAGSRGSATLAAMPRQKSQ